MKITHIQNQASHWQMLTEIEQLLIEICRGTEGSVPKFSSQQTGRHFVHGRGRSIHWLQADVPLGGLRFEFPTCVCYFVCSTADERPSVKSISEPHSLSHVYFTSLVGV